MAYKHIKENANTESSNAAPNKEGPRISVIMGWRWNDCFECAADLAVPEASITHTCGKNKVKLLNLYIENFTKLGLIEIITHKNLQLNSEFQTTSSFPRQQLWIFFHYSILSTFLHCLSVMEVFILQKFKIYAKKILREKT